MGDDHDSLVGMATEIRASDFKATCLALLDDVADHRAEFVITKRGRPVARLVPVDGARDLRGSVRLSSPDDDLFSTGEAWSVET